jgi:hypothetical protein
MKRYCSLCLLSAIGILLGAAPAAAEKPPCSVKEAKVSPASQTLAEGQPVSINGKDGDDRVTYTWVQSGGPAVTPTRSDEKFEFIAPQVGNGGATLTFQLTVACAGTQDSVTATVNVTNLNVNRPPVPEISVAPSPVYEGSAVTLDGTSSSDPDGDALTYSWSQLDGPAVTLAAANTASASFLAPPVGPAGVSLTFRLEVSDGFLSAGTNVVINVVNINQPPQVSLTCPANVNEGASVSLVASASDDDEVASYSWTHVGGAPSITATDTFSPTLDFTAPSLGLGQAGLLTFNILVTDSETLAADATCQVQINDVTPPVLDLPGGITAEATSADGAVVSFAASAEDAHDGAVDATCTPASGSTFALGLTTVDCGSKDAANNEAHGSFSVTVQDTTAPELTLPADLTVEATGPSGAVATFAASASDLVDGDVDVSCSPESGATFALGPTTVSCTARDTRGNEASGAFQVKVLDTTPPALTLPSDVTKEATGPSGATVTFTASATDLVDGSVNVTCTPPSGSTFPVQVNTVECEAVDAAGNKATSSFTVTIVDTTPPALTLPANMIVEATGPSGAAATFSASAQDLVSGSVLVKCTPPTGSTFPITTTIVACSAQDAAGNTANGSFSVTVQDTTPPNISGYSDRSVVLGSTSVPPYYVNPTASDIVDGSVPVICTPGPDADFKLGATAVTCTATDAHQNTGRASFQVTVSFASAGLCLAGPGHQVLQPIALTGSSVFKQSGSTVPVKFRVCDAAGNSYHATNPVTAFQLIQVGSGTVTSEPNTDVVSTSADTAFRWSESDQFWIFNLSTKGYTPATTYVFRITLLDGSAIQFQFGIK